MNKIKLGIIGAGPGGYVAALKAAHEGMDVTLIEKRKVLGGICLNYGCIPSKALIHVANLYQELSSAEEMGITVGEKKLNMKKLQQWKQEKVVNRLNKGVAFLCEKNNVKVIRGKASFLSSQKLLIESLDGTKKELEFDKILIATGSKPIKLPKIPFDKKHVIGSKSALDFEEVPKTLTVIGAGYIGLEMGTLFAKLGSKVSIIEASESILNTIEKELTIVPERKLRRLGVNLYLNSLAEKYENGKLYFKDKTGILKEIETEKVLIAVGRIPLTKGLNLENTKIELDEKGFIKVNKKMQTNDDNIYAIGDLTGQPMLAHKASKEAKIAIDALAGNKIPIYNKRITPAVVFCDPEIAYAGLFEKDAIKQGIKIKIGKFPFMALGKAIANNSPEGFVKIIAEEKTHKVLGVQIVGHNAADVISEAALAIETNAKIEEIAEAVHPHPTMPEALSEAAEDVIGKAIHILPKKIQTISKN